MTVLRVPLFVPLLVSTMVWFGSTPICLGWEWNSDLQGGRAKRLRQFVAQKPDAGSLRRELQDCIRLLATALPSRMEAATFVLKPHAASDESGGRDSRRVEAVKSASRDMLIDMFLIELLVKAGLEPEELSSPNSTLVHTALQECSRARDRGISLDGLAAQKAPAGTRDGDAAKAALEVLDIATKLVRSYLRPYKEETVEW